ncbi:hypothetical protein FNF27_08074 [Cafeteria roenbergensis]|uniref:EF-hand domain-containing protein n=1 Tax=Cafeteria roenbergensis TaxID=33653 RepID=A0A5A8DAV1_CAFRO|nr:hypothetical protein FNF27_08074 [Cafeteria roenbergensis]
MRSSSARGPAARARSEARPGERDHALDVGALMDQSVVRWLRAEWTGAVQRTKAATARALASGELRAAPPSRIEGDGINEVEFARVVFRQARGLAKVRKDVGDVELMQEVLQLFDMIDADSSGFVSWDEFSMACLEMAAMALQMESAMEPVMKHTWQEVELRDALRKQRICGRITAVAFVPDLQQIFVCDDASSIVRVLSPHGRLVASLHANVPAGLKPDDRQPGASGATGASLELQNKGTLTRWQRWTQQKKILRQRDHAWAEAQVRQGMPGQAGRACRTERLKAARILGNSLSRASAAQAAVMGVNLIASRAMRKAHDAEIPEVVSRGLARRASQSDWVTEVLLEDGTSGRGTAPGDLLDIRTDDLQSAAAGNASEDFRGGVPPPMRHGQGQQESHRLTAEAVAKLTELPVTGATIAHAKQKVSRARDTIRVLREQAETEVAIKQVAAHRRIQVAASVVRTEGPSDPLALPNPPADPGPPVLPAPLRAALERSRAKGDPADRCASGADGSKTASQAGAPAASSDTTPSAPTCRRVPPFYFKASESGRVADVGVVSDDHPDPFVRRALGISTAARASAYCLGVEFARPKVRSEDPHVWRHTTDADVTHLLVTTSSEGAILTWNTRSLSMHGCIVTLEQHAMPTWCGPANALFTVTSLGSDVYSWDLLAGTKLATFKDAHTDVISSMVFEPRHSFVVSGGSDGQLLLWHGGDKVPTEVTSAGELGQLEIGVKFMATVPKGPCHLVTTGLRSTESVLWNVKSKTRLLRIPGHGHPVIGIAVTTTEPHVCITADVLGTFRVWNVMDISTPTAQQLQSFKANAKEHTLEGFVLAHPSGEVIPWSTRVHRMRKEQINTLPPIPSVVRYSATLAVLVVAVERSVRVFAASTGALLREMSSLTPDTIVSMTLDGKERKLILGDAQGNIGQFALASGFLLKNADRTHTDDVTNIEVIPKDGLFVSASWDRGLAVLTDQNGGSMGRLRYVENAHPVEISAMSVSRAANLVGTGGVDGSLRLWALDSLELIGPLDGHDSVVADMEFARPDTTMPLLATADKSGVIRLYSTSRGFMFGTPLVEVVNLGIRGATMPVHMEPGVPAPPFVPPEGRTLVPIPITALEVFVGFTSVSEAAATRSDEGRYREGCRVWIFTGDSQGRIQWWDLSDLVAGLRLERYFTGHNNYITFLRFIASPPAIVSSSQDGSVRLWSVEGSPIGVAMCVPPRAARPSRSPLVPLAEKDAEDEERLLREMNLDKSECPWVFPVDEANRLAPLRARAQRVLGKVVPGAAGPKSPLARELWKVVGADADVAQFDTGADRFAIAQGDAMRHSLRSEDLSRKLGAGVDQGLSRRKPAQDKPEPFGSQHEDHALRPEESGKQADSLSRASERRPSLSTLGDDADEEPRTPTSARTEAGPVAVAPGFGTASMQDIRDAAIAAQAADLPAAAEALKKRKPLPAPLAAAARRASRARTVSDLIVSHHESRLASAARLPPDPSRVEEGTAEVLKAFAEIEAAEQALAKEARDAAVESRLRVSARAAADRQARGPATAQAARLEGISVTSADMAAADVSLLRATLPVRMISKYTHFTAEAKSAASLRSAALTASSERQQQRGVQGSACADLTTTKGRQEARASSAVIVTGKTSDSSGSNADAPRHQEASPPTCSPQAPDDGDGELIREEEEEEEEEEAEADDCEASQGGSRERMSRRELWASYGRVNPIAADGLPVTFGPVSRSQVRSVVRLFLEMDKDGLGEVTVDKFLHNSVVEGTQLTQFTRSLFRTLDTDGSGSVSLSELLRAAFPQPSAKQFRSLHVFGKKFHKEQTIATRRLAEAASQTKLASVRPAR